MSCTTATSPIDISIGKISGNCNQKCSYSFKYEKSNTTATNQGDHISLSYSKATDPPVQYNDSNYQVSSVLIYFNSLHSYNNSKTDGELIIVHAPVLGGKELLVCIPITSSMSNSYSSTMMDNIISQMLTQAPNASETAQISNTIDLNKIVQRKQFFTYEGTTIPLQACDNIANFIVFNVLDYTLDINAETLTQVKTIIKQSPYPIKSQPTTKLFFNPDGPNVSKDNQIYIKCQPTGSSGKKKTIKNKGSNVSISNKIQNVFSNDIFRIFFNCVLFTIIISLAYYLLQISNAKSLDGFLDELKAGLTSMMNKITSSLKDKTLV